MSDKELHYNYVLRLIRNAVGDGNFSINHLINDNGLLPDVSEYELREAINWAIRGGVIVSKSGDEDKIPQLSFSKETISDALSEKVDISVTSPKLYSNSIGELAKKNEFISTYFAFKELITSANHVIRISSPFLQRNVGGENSIPEFEEILLSAFRRGCRLIILSREVSSKRASDLGWIVNLTRKNGFSEKLEIFDYHKSLKGGGVDSSNHAKLVISDDSSAYVGSAELRLNSLYKNFEVGVVIRGTNVVGLTELFDAMTRVSKRVF